MYRQYLCTRYNLKVNVHSLPMCLTMFLEAACSSPYSNTRPIYNIDISHFLSECEALDGERKAKHFTSHVFECTLVVVYSTNNCFSCHSLTECEPECKFGVCNTTTGRCICPTGHTGPSCSEMGMLMKYVHIYSWCM